MRFEIDKHWEKQKRISKLSDKDLHEAMFRLLTKIHFVNEELIPERIWLKAEKLTTVLTLMILTLLPSPTI